MLPTGQSGKLKFIIDHYPPRLQKDAKHPETFSPMTLPFSAIDYHSMIKIFNLPFRAIEGTSIVGPLFWSNLDHEPNDPHLRTLGTPHLPVIPDTRLQISSSAKRT